MIYKIARRFLFSVASHSVVNLVAAVSVVAVMVPVVAMVVILSLHNGLQGYVESMYGQFDSELRISPSSGSLFDNDSTKFDGLKSLGTPSRTLEGGVLLEWGSRQHVALMRGVDSMYSHVVPIKERMEQGEWRLRNGDLPLAVVGAGVSYALGLSISIDEPIYVYSLIPTPTILSMLPVPFYNEQSIYAKGLFSLDETTDSRYIFVPFEFAESLLGSTGKLSSIEVKLADNVTLDEAKEHIEAIFGDAVIVQSRNEQRGEIFKVINSEKWLIYALLSLVVVIASLSLAGCTLMMISEKREQSSTLGAMGLSGAKLKQVFTTLGLLIVGIGVVSGIILGSVLSLLQQHFGIIKMAGDTFLMEAYPAHLQATDLVLIAVGVGLIGYVIVRIAAQSATNKVKR